MSTPRIPDDFLDQPDPFVVQINTPDAQGRTPLRQAAFGDDPEMVSALLRSGANPNLPDGQGKTPLQHARSAEVAVALIAGGADLKVRDEQGRTPLHTAVHDPLYFAHGMNYSNRELTHALLASGADVNAFDNEGRTPLHLTLDAHTAGYLVKAGADYTIDDKQGRLPTDGALPDKIRAIEREREQRLVPFRDDITAEDVARFVSTGGDVNGRNLEDRTAPLHHAKSASVAEALIAHGANVNAIDRYGRTPLHYTRSDAVAEVLISHAAVVMKIDGWGHTPLHDAKSGPFAEVLIKHGADVNAKDNWDKRSPLHTAANQEVAEVLIRNGADINAGDAVGCSPLHTAANREVADVLIRSGADINAKHEGGLSALRATRDHAVAESLAYAGADDAEVWLRHHEAAGQTSELIESRKAAIKRGVAHREADQRVQRAGSLDSLYAALDAPAEPVAPRPPRTRQRC